MSTIVWSKKNCQFCEQAKQLLTRKGVAFEVRTIGEGQWTREMLLEAVPTARTVPQIILNDEYVGGYSELKAKLEG